MKKLIGVLVAFLLIATSIHAEAGKTKIMYLTLSAWEANLKVVKAEFEKDYPQYDLQFDFQPYQQIFEILETRFASGDVDADVLPVNCPETPSIVNRGYLLDISKYFAKADTDRWVKKTYDWATVDGKIYAPPLNSSGQVLYYNKALLAQAGIPFPGQELNQRLTWEQLADYARKVQEKVDPNRKNGVWGLMFQQVDVPYQILALPNSKGAEGVGKDGLTVNGLVNGSKWIDALQYYYDCFNTWNISPKGIGVAQVTPLFAAGKIAFLVGGVWSLNSTLKNVPSLDFACAPHPYFKGGTVAVPTDSWHVGVYSKAKNVQGAVDFVRWFSVGRGVDIWFQLFGNLPSDKVLIQKLIDDKEGNYAVQPKYGMKIALQDELYNSYPRPHTVAFREWDSIMSTTLADIRNGAKPKEALDKAVDDMNAVFKKYK